MNMPKKILIVQSLFCLYLSASSVAIAEINLFDKPQGAKAMGEMLFSEESEAKPKMKMRSISFGSPKKKQQETVQKEITKAETQTNKAVASSNVKALALPIKFAMGSTNILPESIPFVDQVGEMLNMQDYKHKKLLIEGHTDASGSSDLNFLLSYRRADAIKYYLISKFNISPSRLTVDGKGENMPLPNTNPNDGVNRRVQLYNVQ